MNLSKNTCNFKFDINFELKMQASSHCISKPTYGQQCDQQYDDDTAYRQYDGGPGQMKRFVQIMPD